VYDCPKWAPVNKEMDLLGSLKCLLKGGGRDLLLGRGAGIRASFSEGEASYIFFTPLLSGT
jgi:hypothetical protein